MRSRHETESSRLSRESGNEVIRLFHYPLLYYPLTHIKRFFFLLTQEPRIGRNNRGIPIGGYPPRGERVIVGDASHIRKLPHRCPAKGCLWTTHQEMATRYYGH